MNPALRIVVVAPDAVPANGDADSVRLAERSRVLRIALLENGFNLIAVLPADTYLRDRLAQLQPDMAWLPPERVFTAQTALRKLMAQFPFALCVPFSSRSSLADTASARDGISFRCAADEPHADELLARIEQILGLDDREVLRYSDKKKGQRRAMRLACVDDQVRLEGFLLAGDTRAQAWVKALLQDQLDAQPYGRQLLLPSTQAPAAIAPQSKPVCTCFNVTQADIDTALAQCDGNAYQRLETLQGTLQCGTNCGSCLPEVKRLVQASCQTEPATA